MSQHPMLHDLDLYCAACGTSFTIRSAAPSMSIDVCSNCHPAYTGEERTIATGGQIDRFNKRRALATA